MVLMEARWRGVPRCPACGSSRALPIRRTQGAWQRWRCGGCRKRYSVTTGTAIHSTKLRPHDWVAAASLALPDEAEIAEAIEVSSITARRIAALLRPVRNSPPTERLYRLLQDRCDATTPRDDPWQVDPLPAGARPEDTPLASLSAGAKATLNALRARPFGAAAAKLASLSGLSYSQTSRCLADLEHRGWATRAKTAVQHGHQLKPTVLWALSWSDGCMRALAWLRDIPTRPAASTGDRVPSRFWRNFWSGAPGDSLRISQHGLHIAETLIGGRDPCARTWAIAALPTSVLQECRTLRGIDKGISADLIGAEIARREAQA